MNSREQKTAFVLVGAIALAVAAAGGYFLVFAPYTSAQSQGQALAEEVAKLEEELAKQKPRELNTRLATERTRSLPTDPSRTTENEYGDALRRVAEAAGGKDIALSSHNADNNPRTVPQLAKDKPAYTVIAYKLTFKKASMWTLMDFLRGYYDLGLLHQITSVEIKKDDDSKNAGNRNNLTVTITSEAIRVDGADARRTLLPVPTAFAAVGGGAMYKGLTLTPEAARKLPPHPLVSTLSPAGRDYSLVVRKDPFNGILVDKPPVPPKPLEIAKISEVKVKPDDKPTTVRVKFSGDNAKGAKFTAVAADGTLFPEGALKVDSKESTIELPVTSASGGTTTVNVLATSADGKETAKTSFKVSIAEPPPAPAKPPLPDIAKYVILIQLKTASDGTAWARVRDSYNRLRYEIDATPKGVAVVKEWSPAADRWRKDLDYEHPAGMLVISDENSSTKRHFKVIAVGYEGLILADMKPGADAEAPKVGKGPGAPRGGPAKQGHADPLAALGGNRAFLPPKPKLYRWKVGDPLANIEAIPEAEAEKIMQAAKDVGPVLEEVASGR